MSFAFTWDVAHGQAVPECFHTKGVVSVFFRKGAYAVRGEELFLVQHVLEHTSQAVFPRDGQQMVGVPLVNGRTLEGRGEGEGVKGGRGGEGADERS